MSNSVDNPFFARLWTVMSAHETDAIRRLRRENLAGLSGRVLEVGAGTGTNFEFYPGAVTEVVAVEPERRLAETAQRAAAAAPVPVIVSTDTVEQYIASGTQPFDAVVCSLVLCSVDEPDNVVRQLYSLLKRGGELRYLEHIAGSGALARLTVTLIGTPRRRSSARVRGVRGAPRVDASDLGSGAGGGVRHRPRGQAGLADLRARRSAERTNMHTNQLIACSISAMTRCGYSVRSNHVKRSTFHPSNAMLFCRLRSPTNTSASLWNAQPSTSMATFWSGNATSTL